MSTPTIKIWATGGGIWRWDSGRDQHYCSEEIKAVVDRAKMLASPGQLRQHAPGRSRSLGGEPIIMLEIATIMDFMAEQGTFFTHTIVFLPTWYSTYPPVYAPELHDKYEGTLVEKELQRNYDCLREAGRASSSPTTIGSDFFSFVTPYGTCSIEEMYEFVDKIGFTPVETITCADLERRPYVSYRTRPVCSRPASAPTCSWSTATWRPHPRPQRGQHGRHHEGRLDRRGRPVPARARSIRVAGETSRTVRGGAESLRERPSEGVLARPPAECSLRELPGPLPAFTPLQVGVGSDGGWLGGALGLKRAFIPKGRECSFGTPRRSGCGGGADSGATAAWGAPCVASRESSAACRLPWGRWSRGSAAYRVRWRCRLRVS